MSPAEPLLAAVMLLAMSFLTSSPSPSLSPKRKIPSVSPPLFVLIHHLLSTFYSTPQGPAALRPVLPAPRSPSSVSSLANSSPAYCWLPCRQPGPGSCHSPPPPLPFLSRPTPPILVSSAIILLVNRAQNQSCLPSHLPLPSPPPFLFMPSWPPNPP